MKQLITKDIAPSTSRKLFDSDEGNVNNDDSGIKQYQTQPSSNNLVTTQVKDNSYNDSARNSNMKLYKSANNHSIINEQMEDGNEALRQERVGSSDAFFRKRTAMQS